MTASSAPSGVDMRLGAAFLLLVSVAAAVVWYRRRRQQVEGIDPTIDVVAVRSIGGKYRLVLVDACGERLLLAATDKDVQMLRSVPASSNTAEFAEALRQRSDGLADVEGLLRLREDRRRATTDLEGVAA
jgi:flagellar biogenesis protein FliO